MNSPPNRGSWRATVHGQRMPTAKRKAAEAPAQSCASETKKQRKQRALPAMTIERDEHCGPVPDAAWQKDAESRKAKGRGLGGGAVRGLLLRGSHRSRHPHVLHDVGLRHERDGGRGLGQHDVRQLGYLGAWGGVRRARERDADGPSPLFSSAV